MATTQSKTFQATPDQVWVAVVKLVRRAGYSIKETNAAARQLVYQASGGGWAWAQNVKVSVVGVDEGETLVTVLAEAAEKGTLTEGPQQQKLVAFVFDALKKQFSPVVERGQHAEAPGSPEEGRRVALWIAGLAAIATTVLLVAFLISCLRPESQRQHHETARPRPSSEWYEIGTCWEDSAGFHLEASFIRNRVVCKMNLTRSRERGTRGYLSNVKVEGGPFSLDEKSEFELDGRVLIKWTVGKEDLFLVDRAHDLLWRIRD
jgi:hypothetical protein